MRFGINLWGVWDQLSADPKKFCKSVSNYGYRYFEPCIVVGKGIEGLPQFMEEDALANLLKIAAAEGIKAESAHVMITDEEHAAEIMQKIAKKYGIRQFVLKCPEPITEIVYEAYAVKLIHYAEALCNVGAKILLHNEGAEIGARLGTMSAYEWLLRRCAGKVYAEPDVGWMLYGTSDGEGGEDPEGFLWRNEEAVQAVHYKDFAKNEHGTWKQCAIGDGVIDMGAVFRFARTAEVIQYVDQDSSDDMMRDLKNAADRLNQLQFTWGETRSTLCILDTETGEVQRLHTFDKIIEAPNWMRDGNTLIYNSGGHIYRYSISEGQEVLVDTGFCNNCNNDHVLSPDNTRIAVSHWDENGISRIYTIPIEGGVPLQVTGDQSSYLHGWSPDGKELALCGFRTYGEGAKESVDVICIPAEGGEERRLTDTGFNDGPEYAPDGKKIWFISTRSGLMQVWKMDRDGSNQQQMTFEEQNNWFAHVSPNGKKVVNIAYSKDGLDPEQHLPNMHVSLWLMNPDGSGRRKLLDFFGGQGSINVNSWSLDSRRLAFVEYEMKHK